MHLMRLLFFFKRLRSTYLGREKMQQRQHESRSIPSLFFFLSFLLATVLGNTLREEQSPHVGESKTVFDSGFQIPGTRFRFLLVKFGFWIPIFSWVPDSLSCIPDSKAQDAGFHKEKIPGFWNPDFLDLEREEETPAVNALVFPFSMISGSAQNSIVTSTFGGQSVCLFSFSPLVCARPRHFSLCPDKPGACYAGYNNLTAEPGNSVTNCILMSDPLVLFFNKNQRTSCIHKSIISEQYIKNYNFQPRMRIKGEDYQPFLSIFFFFFGFGRHIGFWEAADATRSAASFSNHACLSREKTFLDY